MIDQNQTIMARSLILTLHPIIVACLLE